MSAKVESFTYKFSELVILGHRPQGRTTTTWYIECPECNGQHMFRKTGSKVWHTSCWFSGVEWTITPAEYYVLKPCDFSKILGQV